MILPTMALVAGAAFQEVTQVACTAAGLAPAATSRIVVATAAAAATSWFLAAAYDWGTAAGGHVGLPSVIGAAAVAAHHAFDAGSDSPLSPAAAIVVVASASAIHALTQEMGHTYAQAAKRFVCDLPVAVADATVDTIRWVVALARDAARDD
mmetsp:Transcript_63/g.222  ORF Transcript_63/g.222 Transcript_63/m.222 type:complete len:152 (-) Transcript_63:34-489(-)